MAHQYWPYSESWGLLFFSSDFFRHKMGWICNLELSQVTSHCFTDDLHIVNHIFGWGFEIFIVVQPYLDDWVRWHAYFLSLGWVLTCFKNEEKTSTKPDHVDHVLLVWTNIICIISWWHYDNISYIYIYIHLISQPILIKQIISWLRLNVWDVSQCVCIYIYVISCWDMIYLVWDSCIKTKVKTCPDLFLK